MILFLSYIALAVSLPTRQIGEVVGAMCARPDGASVCVAGFVANATATTTHVISLNVVGSWKFAIQNGVPELVSKDDELYCAQNTLFCRRSGAFAAFGNYSFVIEFRMRSNSSREETLLAAEMWSIVMSPAGTLRFRFQVSLAGQIVLREYKVESDQVVNDGQWRTVRFSRAGAADFAFAFDGVEEKALTLDIPSDSIVDISLQPFTANDYSTFTLAHWVPSAKYPTGVLFDTVSISVGEHIAKDLFSFDTATGGNVVLGDFLVDVQGCVRNSSLCQSCSFCSWKAPNSESNQVYFDNGQPYVTYEPAEVSRERCPSSQLFVPRSEGACCGRCFGALEPVKFCKYRSGCMLEFISAHECKACGIADAEIKCAGEQSAKCAEQTAALCKLSAIELNSTCLCDGQIEKQPESALVCSRQSEQLLRTCDLATGSTGKENYTREWEQCHGLSNRTFDLDLTRKRCIGPGGWRRKRHSLAPCSSSPSTPRGDFNGQQPLQQSMAIMAIAVALLV